MKKKYLILLVLSAFFAACTDKFEDDNTDVKNPAHVSGEALFSNAQKELVDQISSTNVNLNVWKLFSQYWTETTYVNESNYDIVNRTIADLTFREYYRGFLRDFKEATTLIKATKPTSAVGETEQKNKLAIVKLMVCYSYQQLVDIFGNVPYTQAEDINIINPAYDDAATIYTSLIDSTNAALAQLDESQGSFGSADLIYQGDIASWKKFGNSLKIKMGVTLSDLSGNLGALAKSTVESAVAGAFTSSADNATFAYQSTSPNYNPLYADLVASGRKDFVAANTLVDILNKYNDPRIFAYLSDPVAFLYRAVHGTKQDSVVTEGIGKKYVYNNISGIDSVVYLVPPYTILASDSSKDVRLFDGGPYGYSCPYALYSHIAAPIQEPDFHGLVMTYDEIAFYLAEAAARGFEVGGTAEEYYNTAVKASFELWGLSETAATDYLATPAVAWATAQGDWKQKIGTQAWIGFYTRGLEAYTEWRRLDYPILNVSRDIAGYTDIPARFTYPINEQTLNADNWKTASQQIGGDALTTRLFWDTATGTGK